MSKVKQHCRSLFFISTIDQMQQAQLFIQKKKLKDTTLVVLYTCKNFDFPSKVRASKDSRIFNYVLCHLLPKNQNLSSFFNVLSIKLGYRSLLRSFTPSSLYVFNHNGHYAILCEEGRKRGVSVNLIDGFGRLDYLSIDNKIFWVKKALFIAINRSFLSSMVGYRAFDSIHSPLCFEYRSRGKKKTTSFFSVLDIEFKGRRRKAKNLFVISHFGQLGQIEAFLRKYSMGSVQLVILYTRKNLEMPQMILRNLNRKLYTDVHLHLLPPSPGELKHKKQKVIFGGYCELLHRINPEQLYILSFDNHYSTLATLAKSKGVSVNLIEEGTATYSKPPTLNLSTLEKYCIYRNRPIRATLRRYTNFDVVYASFPDLLKDSFRNADVRRFFLYEEVEVSNESEDEFNKMIHSLGISKRDFIFASQRYPIAEELYVETLVEILDQLCKRNKNRIFIKLHPKDSSDYIEIYNRYISKMSLEDRIFLIPQKDFLLERFIKESQVSGVVGLTSTTLIYGPEASEEATGYSIFPWFEKIIREKSGGTEESAIKLIESHFDILQMFKNVQLIES